MSQACRLMTFAILAMLILSCSGVPAGEEHPQGAEAEQQPLHEDGFESGQPDEWQGGADAGADQSEAVEPEAEDAATEGHE